MKNSKKISLAGLVLTGLGILTLIFTKLVFAAGTASLSLMPASATVSQGSTLNVDIYEDSGSDTINAVQANFTYPSGLLTYTGVTSSSAFTVDAQSAGTGGTVQIARGATTPVSGNQLVATIHFTVAGGGTANLSFASGSAVVRSTDNGAETLATNDASYTLISPATIGLSPASQSLNKGDALSISIYENSGGTPVNAVQADLTYPANLLSFVSIDPAAGSAFTVDAQATGGGGVVKIGRGTTTPVTGNQLVGVVHFTAAAAGSANVAFDNSTTAVIRSSDNGPESLTEYGGIYTVTTPPPAGGGSVSTSPKTTVNQKTGSPAASAPASNSQPSQPPVTTNVDNKPPVISAIQVTKLSLKTATITWLTSEPATSEVDFGFSSQYLLSATDSKLTKNHAVTLNSKDLIPHSTYHFIVKSVDSAGNLSISKDLSFKTEPARSKPSSVVWAAVAALAVVVAVAYVGWGYFQQMRSNKPPTPPATPSLTGGSGPAGGAVIKPGSGSNATSAAVVPKNAIILNAATPELEKPITTTDEAKIIKPTATS